ncbi:hypothetical protein KX928_09485 [Roseobacter sp. YSTF-M11]|uniref:Uncharacterized protein n=1 Tax=Roseobacter insulae TaxID=2859783 RepID=A0A9X1FUQ0_9RHOB|nr:hypothetical protein [Roseobacter insulae]MBW4708018.1 hypothetical protein [Roseobacter insulae]
MSASSSDLAMALEPWDQTSATDIADIYQRYQHQEDFLPALIRCSRREECERGATWLIKHHCEKGGASFSDDDRHAFYRGVGRLVHWEAKLHVLQTMPAIAVPRTLRSDVKAFVLKSLADSNKLVIAWAYFALALLADQFPEYREEALGVLALAAPDYPSGAIAVRIRKARALLA